MLTGLKDVLSMFWTRIRRVESWVYGLSQSPMIIEEGESYVNPVTWTYRKWSDGRAECWGVVPANVYACTTASGYAYYTAQSFNLPTDLFTSVEVGFASRLQGTGSSPSNTLITINTRELTTTTINVWVQSANSQSTQSLSIALYIRGNWKTPINVTTTLNGNYYTDDVWNYNFLINKPSINDITLAGNKTSADLGVANQSDVDYIRSRLQAITTEGGEPNAIDSISVNGVATTPDINKNVSLTIPNISISTSAPTILDGANGDIWFVYEAPEIGE